MTLITSHRACIALILLWTVGCHEAERSVEAPVEFDVGVQRILDGGVGGSRIDAGQGQDTDQGLPDTALPDAQHAEETEVARVEVSLEPQKTVYAPGHTALASAAAFDRFGEPVDGVRPTWTVSPGGMAEIDSDGQIRFLNEGQGVLLGCVDTLCGRRVFLVDRGPPSLRLYEPRTEARVAGRTDGFIAVSGVATDSFGRVSIRVNGTLVELSADGEFSTRVPARVGINHIEVSAEDGVSPGRTTVSRDVLMASDFRFGDGLVTRIENAISLKVGASVFGGGRLRRPAGEEPMVVADDLSSLLQMMLERIPPNLISPMWQIAIADGQALTLELVGIHSVDVEASIGDSGIEMFIHLTGVDLRTRGELVVDGESLSLAGHLAMDVFSVANMSAQTDQRIEFEFTEGETIIDGLVPQYPSPLAASLFNERGDLGRQVMARVAENVEGFLEERLPSLFDSAFEAWCGDVQSNRRLIELGDRGTDFETDLFPESIIFSADHAMLVRFVGEWLPTHLDDGVVGRPWFAESPIEFGGEEALDFSVSLNLLNALLYEAWLQGAFGGPFMAPAGGAEGVDAIELRWGLPPVVAPSWRPGAAQLVLQFGDGQLSLLDEDQSVVGQRVLGLHTDLEAVLDGGSIQVLPGVPRWFSVASSIDGRPAVHEGHEDSFQENLWPSLMAQVQSVLRVGFRSVAVDASVLNAGTDGISDIRMEAIIDGPTRLVGHRLHWLGRTQTVVEEDAPIE